jgi:hypothetical protein
MQGTLRGIQSGRRWTVSLSVEKVSNSERKLYKYCTPYAIIGDQASPPADLFLSGQQSVVPRWPGKPMPPPISFDVGGGDRVKRQGAKFATRQNRMRQLVRSSPVTRDSWTVTFGSGSATSPGTRRGPGAQAMAFFACALPRPCSNGRTHQSRRSAHVCRRLDDLKSIRTQLASFTALVPASQQQQYSTHDELDWTRLDSTGPDSPLDHLPGNHA